MHPEKIIRKLYIINTYNNIEKYIDTYYEKLKKDILFNSFVLN